MGAERWTVGDVAITKVHEITLPAPRVWLLRRVHARGRRTPRVVSRPHFIDSDGNLQMSVHALVLESRQADRRRHLCRQRPCETVFRMG